MTKTQIDRNMIRKGSTPAQRASHCCPDAPVFYICPRLHTLQGKGRIA